MYVVCALSLALCLRLPFAILCSCSKLCLLLWFHAVVSSSGLEPLIGVLEEMLRRAYTFLYDGIEKCDGLKVYLCSSWSSSSQAYLAPLALIKKLLEAKWNISPSKSMPSSRPPTKYDPSSWNNGESISQVGGFFCRTTNWFNTASLVP